MSEKLRSERFTQKDAFICAHLARVFVSDRASLHSPEDCPLDTDEDDGWIWFHRRENPRR